MERAKVIETFFSEGFQQIKTAIGKGQVSNTDETTTFGFIGRPYRGMNVIRSFFSKNSVTIGIVQKAVEDLKEGECVMFSKERDGYKAKLYARIDGCLELNGNDDFAVRYSELKKQFDSLQKTVDDFITGYNTHTHLVQVAPLPAPPTPSDPTVLQALPSTADISTCKVDTVKLPK